MKKFYLASSLAVLAILTPMTAQAGEKDVSVSATLDLVSDYVFRGVSFAGAAVQPGIEVAYGNLSVGAWYSTEVEDTTFAAGDEIDLYASYAFDLSDAISASVGGTYYHYPSGGGLFSTNGGNAGSYEISAGVSFDMPLEPSIATYYDFTLETLTAEGGIGHSYDLANGLSLDLGLTAGLVDGDGFSYEYGVASASLGYAISDNVSASLGANYAISSEKTLDYEAIFTTGGKANLLFFGAGLSSSF